MSIPRIAIHRPVTMFMISGVIILLGVAFLGLIPGLQREWRIHRLPAARVAPAPVLGAIFALGCAVFRCLRHSRKRCRRSTCLRLPSPAHSRC